MMTQRLPSSSLRDADWEDVKVDWMNDPRLFEGVRGRRVVAYLIDLAIVATLIVVLWAVAIGPVLLSFGLLQPALLAATALLPFAYHTACIGGPWHATVGMRVMNLTVIGIDGDAPDYIQAAIQTGIFLITAAITQFFVVLVSFFNDRGRCLHDFVAGTVVVNRRVMPADPAARPQ